MRFRGILLILTILFLAHWFVFQTWLMFREAGSPASGAGAVLGVALLSASFVVATVLAHRYANAAVRLFYQAMSVWLGVLNFLVLAACGCWLIFLVVRLAGWPLGRPGIAAAMYALALVASLYGVINASLVRVKRIRVRLPDLPGSWRGRFAALVSDVHLGHVKGDGFSRRIVALLQDLKPDVLFITGDFYDGSMVDQDALALPWKELAPPLGAYFVSGNHEEYTGPAKFLEAIARSGIRVLNNEKVSVDGLQIVGVHYRALANPARFREVLGEARIDRSRASILLAHAPHGLAIAEAGGVSLQLSGHTHGGQIFPFTWFTSRIFGEYTYGLRRFGELLVYTSSGAGTWGPPMRVGTAPEVAVIEFVGNEEE